LILQRNKATFQLAPGEHQIMKERMLDWSKQFSILLFLDSNEYQHRHAAYECLLAANAVTILKHEEGDALQEIHNWHQQHRDWLFGHISYDYKNLLEPRLSSAHPSKHNFQLLQFFCPQFVCFINREKTELTIECLNEDPTKIFNDISNAEKAVPIALPQLSFTHRIDQQTYLSVIDKLRNHIAEGDCYEINFCTEGFCENANIDPLTVFRQLNKISPAPFAAYYRLNDQYMICASPERYLCKRGNTVFSQPIKGTAKRGSNEVEDAALKAALGNSIKDKAENVMIVDLVRNDLARSCETGTVMVEELFGIYTFPQVHQMISSVSGTLKAGSNLTDSIRHSFPMGSMTGAPKIKVMELIDAYEQSRRELFSGTVGYFSPDGDFDCNVVIRSMFYNAGTAYLAYQTGGAITYDSDPLQEWEELRLKAWALERIFS